MTTEIAVMNKTGIALAADSAVTIESRQSQGKKLKIYNTANKLFALSKHAPVGIMIYGNTNLMGVPWETIIKCYRKRLGIKKFNTIKEYCEDFFYYLSRMQLNKESEQYHIIEIAVSITKGTRAVLDKHVEKSIQEKGSIAENEIISKLNKIIKKDNKMFSLISKKSIFNIDEIKEIRKKHIKDIDSIIDKVLDNIPLSKYYKNLLIKNIIMAVTVPRILQSGVVVSGFGERDMFPSCYEFNVDSVISGKVVKKDEREEQISEDCSASIIPFAQAEEVATFMEGIGGRIKKLLEDKLKELITNKLAENIGSVLGNDFKISKTKKRTIINNIKKIGKGAYDEFSKHLDQDKNQYYIKPVIEAVKYLNKGELAEMAETLVNLVSFRKQVTLEEETVGGPIDVAIITKGDGLIWIKRKLYFEKDLNHHFFDNYFYAGEKDEKEA